jgi:hypothetical protein
VGAVVILLVVHWTTRRPAPMTVKKQLDEMGG